MSTPQKQAGSWRPPQALLHKENMGAFRCVSNTKQQALCSLVQSPQRQALATPRTSCGKLKPDSWTAVLMNVWFCKLFSLFFLFFKISFCFGFFFFFSFNFYFKCLIVLLCIIILCLSTPNKLERICLCGAILLPVQQISYLSLDIKCKTKPYATNCCKLPWIQVIITKNLYEFEASLILQPFCFAMKLPSTHWGLVCYPGRRHCNQASIITLPEAEWAWGPRQQALMWGTVGC